MFGEEKLKMVRKVVGTNYILFCRYKQGGEAGNHFRNAARVEERKVGGGGV